VPGASGSPAADMTPAARTRETAPRQVITALAGWRAAHTGVLVVAIDGHGTAGKTTVSSLVADAVGAGLVHTDDFFGQLPAPAAGQPPGRRPLSQYYDWRRLRTQALEPLRAGRRAAFRRFDWSRGGGLDRVVWVAPASVILLEGVFSASPELSDLVDRSVFVDTPERDRLRRLHAQVAPEDWDADWLTAQESYFRLIRPTTSFDLIVSGASPWPAGLSGGTS
jgi:uridine kinase